jgi:hypothetical protein
MDQAIQLIERWGEKLAELAAQVGPEVFALAMTAIIVQHISAVVWGAFLMCLGIGFGYASYRGALYASKKNPAVDRSDYADYIEYRAAKENQAEKEESRAVVGVVSIFAALLCFTLVIVGASSVFDVWNWAALYDPRLIIAKRVLSI